MTTKRIGHWLQLGFWKLAVGTLSISRPIGARLLFLSKGWPGIRSEDKPFVHKLFWAISGWACGIVIGFAVTFWWAQ